MEMSLPVSPSTVSSVTTPSSTREATAKTPVSGFGALKAKMKALLASTEESVGENQNVVQNPEQNGAKQKKRSIWSRPRRSKKVEDLC
jgi:hypothetical protein